MDEKEVRAMIQRKETERKMQVIKQASVDLSHSWQTIQNAHDSTTVAMELREAGLQREFWLQALADITSVVGTASELRKSISRFLVDELDVSSRTVATVADVSPSTISTWRGEHESS
ncbi:TPA: hypothetical protein ACL38W_002016 [Streptococcus pneumoniae]|jgi:hypothetical protein|uniref:hypothetical protein n=2 Tax=cellular organisms TaxID=131567 RepID=UPI0007BB980D|nr:MULTISPECIES: hypothetical protein [Bacteria]KZF13760.1 hypothetical protein A2J01_34445 [Rhodococcus sp. EPR-134]MRN36910.1 hypothetical protein [Pasteurella multocida]